MILICVFHNVIGSWTKMLFKYALLKYTSPSGACEASLACTTCHVYVHENYGDKLPEASEE